jgi:ribosomal protein L4
VHVITVDQLNTHDVVVADWVVFTQAALERVNQAKPAAKKAAGEGGEGA